MIKQDVGLKFGTDVVVNGYTFVVFLHNCKQSIAGMAPHMGHDMAIVARIFLRHLLANAQTSKNVLVRQAKMTTRYIFEKNALKQC